MGTRRYKSANAVANARRHNAASERRRMTKPGKKKLYQEAHKRSELRRKYGATDAQIEAHLAKINCDICGRRPNGRIKHLAMDHCHKTGKVRGSLCTGCNRLLGRIEKNLTPITSYLEKHGVTHSS